MKNGLLKLLIIAAIGIVAVIMSGCASKSIDAPTDIPQIEECVIDGVDAPYWTCDISHVQDYITATGSSNVVGSYYFRKSQAVLAARGSLAAQLKTKVLSSSKYDEDNTGANASINIEAKVDNTLENSKVVSFWSHPETKEVFILIGVKDKK